MECKMWDEKVIRYVSEMGHRLIVNAETKEL